MAQSTALRGLFLNNVLFGLFSVMGELLQRMNCFLGTDGGTIGGDTGGTGGTGGGHGGTGGNGTSTGGTSKGTSLDSAVFSTHECCRVYEFEGVGLA
ncbi:MAG: hypothetical protein JSS49_02070 [Planctomycetes bacterium]|nr:hypothetical protein [Planctomycetota bacterium]